MLLLIVGFSFSSQGVLTTRGILMDEYVSSLYP